MRVTIERLAYGGDGVAHLEDGRVAFVNGGCPGDTVEATIAEEHPRWVRMRIDEIVEPSSGRVEPPCRYFGVCGGCQWQHVADDLQLTAKADAVTDALRRIGRQDVTAAACVGDGRRLGYRNKIELLAGNRPGSLAIGFARAGSNELVAIDECLLLPASHRKAPKALSGALRYLFGGRDPGLVRVGLRCAHRTKDVEVAVWTAPGPFPRAMAARTLTDATKATSVVRVLTKGEPGERRVSGVEVLRGKGAWRERLGGYTMLVSAPSFFQVNTPVAESMTALAVEELAPDGSDRVLDLYAGAGTFTLPLAAVAGEVVAVEQSGAAIGDLRRNLDAAGLHADIAPGDAARTLPELGSFDLAIVDPPRSGMDAEALAALTRSRARRIVYVSCDPTTLARDARAMSSAGYRLVRATPVDLFPQTYHVETVAVFDAVD